MFYEHSHWYAPPAPSTQCQLGSAHFLCKTSWESESPFSLSFYLRFFSLSLLRFGSWPSANHINVPLFEISARLMSFNLHLAVFSLSSRSEREREGERHCLRQGPIIWLWRSVHNLTFIYIWMPFSIAQLHKSIVYGAAWVVAQQQQKDQQNTKEIFITIYIYIDMCMYMIYEREKKKLNHI